MRGPAILLFIILQWIVGFPFWMVGWACAFAHNYFTAGFMAFYEYFDGEE